MPRRSQTSKATLPSPYRKIRRIDILDRLGEPHEPGHAIILGRRGHRSKPLDRHHHRVGADKGGCGLRGRRIAVARRVCGHIRGNVQRNFAVRRRRDQNRSQRIRRGTAVLSAAKPDNVALVAMKLRIP